MLYSNVEATQLFDFTRKSDSPFRTRESPETGIFNGLFDFVMENVNLYYRF